MPSNLRHGLGRLFNRSSICQDLMFAFCVLIGVAVIFSVQPAGDGIWFWYASLLHSGKLLYADLHLALQPLFVLETDAFMTVFGKGWLVSKLPAILHLLAYCIALLILVRKSNLSDARKAIILGCAFFVSISFEAYRFDDYHVLTDCFQLYSLITLLSLQRASSARAILTLSTVVGVLSGFAITTRLNDGGALLVGVLLGIACLAPSRRLLSLLLCCFAAGLTVVLIVSLTGDSLQDYAMYSIFKAASSKGGAGNVLTYPLHLPLNTFRWLRGQWHLKTIPYAIMAALIWSFLLRPITRHRGRKEILLAALGILLLALRARRMYFTFKDVYLIANLAGLLVFVAYAAGIWVFVQFLWNQFADTHQNRWDRRQILLVIPLGQLASSSMSSGGTHLGLYGPIAILILLLSLFSPIHFKSDWPRESLMALATLLLCCTANYRIGRPFSWHTYVEPRLFTGRVVYHHPDYGPMVIDRDMLQMIQPICRIIQDGGSDNELLSLPFPYPNYFCAIPPWHGYVQTFFDTSSKETIQGLMNELQQAPPKWIVYQRQIHTLRVHELIYNQGKPLQQRYLDQLIREKVDQHAWQVVYASNYGEKPDADNDWYLIRTR